MSKSLKVVDDEVSSKAATSEDEQAYTAEGSLSAANGATDLRRKVLDALPWVAWPLAAAFVCAIVFLIAFGLLSPSATTYRTAISVTMPGASEGKYPNGMEFSATDLLSPAVVRDVYSKNNLERYGLSAVDFIGGLSAQPFSPNYNMMVERYQQRLGIRNLTPEERRSIETEMKEEIERTKHYGVIIALTVPDSVRIPENVALKAVADIPRAWSNFFTETIGVIGTKVPRSGGPLVDIEFLETLDYPLAYDYLSDSLSQIKSRIMLMSELPGAATTVDTANKSTIDDLARAVDRMEKFAFERIMRPIVDLGLAKNPELTRLAYENLVADLTRQQALAQSRASAVSGIVEDGKITDSVPRLVEQQRSGAAEGPFGNVTTIPQLGDGFIDRIINLSATGQNTEYRQGLLSRKLDLIDESEMIRSRIETAKSRLAAIEGFNKTYPGMQSMVEIFTANSKAAADEMNRLWVQSNDLLDLIGARNLSNEKLLYSSISIGRQVEHKSFLGSGFLWLAAMGLIIVAVASGICAFLIRQFLTGRLGT